MLHKCTHRLINACRIRACLQKMIYLTYVYFFFIVILNGFLFMCMTGQSVFCMNTHIHPQRTTNHLSPTAKVCQGTEKDPHSSARQPNVTNTNRNTWEENNSWRTCTPGCYTWAACHTVINKSVCTIQIFFLQSEGFADQKIQPVQVTTDKSSVAQLAELLLLCSPTAESYR